MSFDILTSEQVAREYWRTNSWRKFGSARELVDDIDQYMASKGLARSTISRLEVAHDVVDLQSRPAQAAPVSTPEQVAWSNEIAQGVGDRRDDLALQQMDELALAGRVQAMGLAEFGAERERLGVTRSVGNFLSGN